jgi:hypothetical protein
MNPFHQKGARRAITLPLVIVAIGMAAASAWGSSTLPASPTVLDARAASGDLKIRPVTIGYAGDGTGFLGGASVASSGINWTKWTSHIALGTGFNQLDDCIPNCAQGTFHGFKVSIELWRPRILAGHLVFTRMTIFYKKSRPKGEPRHYTFTDIFTRRAGYGWGPPSEQGFCVNTSGQKPAAGCKNIHALPPS